MNLKLIATILIACAVLPSVETISAHAAEKKEPTRTEGTRVENPLFGYTHLLPSPFTIPAGKLALGTQISLGVTDFFQVGTNVIRDFYRIYNVNAKASILDFPEYAAALTVEYEHFNYKDIDTSNPDLSLTSWQPGAVFAYEALPYLSHSFGGNLSFTNIDAKTSGVQTSGYVRGVTVETDLSWAYNPKKKSLGNVLSTGLTYDFTFKIYGVGISHHWSGFQVGLHYYPDASKYRVMPILVGGAVVDL